MADFSKVTVNGTTYNVKDATARTAASAAQTTANSKLSDAPSDGKQYARQDGEWAEVSGGGGSSETQPWPITSLADDTIQKWATIPNGTYWYGNNGYFNSPENLQYGFLEHKVIGGDVTQIFYTQSQGPIFRRSGYFNFPFSNWFKFKTKELNNKWYLVDGVTENEVLAAYQFVGRNNKTEALININDGTSYPLTTGRNDIEWIADKGIRLLGGATWENRLINQDLSNRYNEIYTAAFGYSGYDTTKYAGGIYIHDKRFLLLSCKDSSGGSVYYPAINYSTTSSNERAMTNGNTKLPQGVLVGTWGDPSCLFMNGEQLATSGNYTGNGNNYQGILSPPNAANTAVSQLYVTAIVLLKTQINSLQALELSNNIRALGGIDS